MRKGGQGFTLIEVLIVIFVIGTLLGLVVLNIIGSKERTYFTRAQTELSVIANATKLYVAKYNEYPSDTPEAGIPSPIMEFIAQGERQTQWPDAPWPGTLYDYDAWDLVEPGAAPGTWERGTDGTLDTFQISIRFCTYAERLADPQICVKRAPKEPWAASFNSNNNSVYWCLKGYCRPNSSTSWDYPGYCLNCSVPNNKGIKADGE